MTTSASLTSDHVNYLIFRYLQEAGLESTATAFYRDWHRPSDYRDPENYPFAPVVRRNELISIIQRGLHHDELESRVRKNETTFNFTRVTSRQPLEGRQRDTGALENGVAPQASATGPESRPGSAAKRKGRPSVARIAQQDFPTPPPKRQRRSEGSEGVHLNGHAMDVDAASPSVVEADEDGEAISPNAASELEMPEIPERYDSMDVAVQTEVKPTPKTSTMYWKVDKPQATIYHSVFNPNVASGSANTLMTVGESLCRFYQVPENAEDAQQILSVDEPSLPSSSVVTASAWHPHGHIAALAADSIRDVVDDSQSAQQAVFAHDCRTGAFLQYEAPPLLEPQGIVLALRYNAQGSKLAVLRTNLKFGSVIVYDSHDLDAEKARPIAWTIHERPALDIAWVAPDVYFVVGEKGSSEFVHLADEAKPVPEELVAANTAPSIGVSHRSRSGIPLDGQDYDKLRLAPERTVAALASTQGKRLVLGQYNLSNSTKLQYSGIMEVDEQMTAITFQPTTDVWTALVFAVAFEDGSCDLCTYNPAGNNEANVRKVLRLYLQTGPALAIAWSPDGAYLAVAGMDLVQIWEIESLLARNEGKLEKKMGTSQKALISWRPDANTVGRRNGEHELPTRALSEPSLSWSADGESLAFAVDREIAVIRFRPSLKETEDREELNGRVSP